MASGNFDFGIADKLSSSQSSSIDEEDMQRMESAAVPDSTSNATKSGVKKNIKLVEETKHYC